MNACRHKDRAELQRETTAEEECIKGSIVYGGQVFRLDLVMMGVVVLALCALAMYEVVNLLEKLYYAKSNTNKPH